jgi:hypothetical protein
VYSTCILCHRPLGTNHTIPNLPVGRRIAFDPSRGRLWVVCTHCGEWNLTPLEDRWEALAQCEAACQQVESRAQAEGLSFAECADGTALIRIGQDASRNDIANTRYGRRLHQRRGRYALVAAVTLGLALAATNAVGVVTGSLILAVWLGAYLWFWLTSAREIATWRVLARCRTQAGALITIRYWDLPHIEIRRKRQSAKPVVVVTTPSQELAFQGEAAIDLLAVACAATNRQAGSPAEIQAAVQTVDNAEAQYPDREASAPLWERVLRVKKRARLIDLPLTTRLALEMMLVEHRELRALRDMATEHERAWNAAEPIAAIADDLLVPPGITAWLIRFRPIRDE